MIENSNISYLVGDKNFSKKSLEPFDENICDFLDQLSKYLMDSKNSYNYSDVKTFAFFCRKKNILNLKKNAQNLLNKRGLGLLFHITPSNIPTNFAYSLLFGLLSGNKNIVKVPSKTFPQISLICTGINQTLKKFRPLKDMIKIVKYSNNDEFTKKISSLCDGRLVWGGNKTIKKIREFPIKEISRDISFADRNSFCVLNNDKLALLDENSLRKLALKFYNDTFLVDQNACSSPHVVFWLGKKNKKIKNKFWSTFYKVVKSKYVLDNAGVFYKHDRLFSDFISKNNVQAYTKYGNLIYCVELNKDSINPSTLISRWGYFYEISIKKLEDLTKYSNVFTQTLTYFGFEKNNFQVLIKKKNMNGIDRIVPVGQALDINLNWDGYDIINILTKVIDLR